MHIMLSKTFLRYFKRTKKIIDNYFRLPFVQEIFARLLIPTLLTWQMANLSQV